MSSANLPGQPEVRKAMPASMMTDSSDCGRPKSRSGPDRQSASGRRARRSNRPDSAPVARGAIGRAGWRADGPSGCPFRGRSRTCGCARPDRRGAGSSSMISRSVSPMPTMICAPNFFGPKMSRASIRISQYFAQVCGDCTPLPRVRSNSAGVAASSATVKMSEPRSRRRSHVVARHRGGVGQDRDRDGVGVDPVGPFLQDGHGVFVRIADG